MLYLWVRLSGKLGRVTSRDLAADGSYVVPNYVTTIGRDSFRDLTNLASVTIPNSVTKIGWRAFSYCSNLTSITIPNSVTKVGWRAFDGCANLNQIIIENGNDEDFARIRFLLPGEHQNKLRLRAAGESKYFNELIDEAICELGIDKSDFLKDELNKISKPIPVARPANNHEAPTFDKDAIDLYKANIKNCAESIIDDKKMEYESALKETPLAEIADSIAKECAIDNFRSGPHSLKLLSLERYIEEGGMPAATSGEPNKAPTRKKRP